MKEPIGAPQSFHPHVTRRSSVLLGIAGVLFALLLMRILILQTVEYDRYQKKVIEQMTTEASVNASRGGIYDRNGSLLATNVTTYRVFISPSSIAGAQTEANRVGENVRYDELISRNLSDLLGVSYDFVLKQTTYTKYLDRTVKKEVDEATADRVREFIAEYGLQRMIYLQTTSSRYYPYSELACHTVGFTGSDGTGLYGLEYYYNEILSGTNGRYITARDARGNEMPYEYKEYIEPENGYNLNTTLDVFVQSALEEQVEAAYLNAGGKNRAAGIVMDVNTGEILGMCTYPFFDLNDPRTLDEQSRMILDDLDCEEDSEEYVAKEQELLLNMWKNKAVTDAYIPGSTFKVITASMALEEAVVTTSETHTCVGYERILGHVIHCHKTTGHGTLTFAEGIQQSCNPWLMTVGLRIGKESFYDYLKAFGYMEKTGIDLPGEGGSILAKEENFTDLDLAIYAFGQNFNVTLLQQITAVSAVANGGYLVTPHLLSSVTDDNGNVIRSYDTNVRRQVVSASVCKTVANILEEGVSGDGGAKNAYVVGYRVAAKTGTSEKKDAGKEGTYVCSTVAFAPAENPRYAVIIIVDEPSTGILYGSTVAAPYVANVLETILPYLGVDPVYNEKELQKLTVTAPSYQYWSASLAKRTAESEGWKVTVVGDPDGVVFKQYPAPGTVLEKESANIVLYTDREAEAETVRVPDLIGMKAQAANKTLVNAGLNIRVSGTKNYRSLTDDDSLPDPEVVSQSAEPGTYVSKGTVIEVTFRYKDDTD